MKIIIWLDGMPLDVKPSDIVRDLGIKYVSWEAQTCAAQVHLHGVTMPIPDLPDYMDVS